MANDFFLLTNNCLVLKLGCNTISCCIFVVPWQSFMFDAFLSYNEVMEALFLLISDVMAAIGKLKGHVSVENMKITDKIESLTARLDSFLLLQSTSVHLGNTDFESLHMLPATTHEELKCIELELHSNVEYRKFLVIFGRLSI